MRMSTFFVDFKYSIRTLQRSPGFAVIAILALALGIGANVAVFSAVDAMLLRPMQFRDASRLVKIFEDGSKIGFPKILRPPRILRIGKRGTTCLRTWPRYRARSMPSPGTALPSRSREIRVRRIYFRCWG